MYLHTMCISGTHRGQKKASGPLELELQAMVSCQVNAGNGNQVLCKRWKVLLITVPSLQPKKFDMIFEGSEEHQFTHMYSHTCASMPGMGQL